MSTHTYYIDPVNGDDAGDRVLFKRGSVIRGMLHARNGAEGAPVTYGAYGDGAKPAFLGSVAGGDPAAWTEVRPHVWRFAGALDSDACNLVFDGGTTCGILRWKPEELRQPGDWHHTAIGRAAGVEHSGETDTATDELYLYAEDNPGRTWHDIECALWGQRQLVGGDRHLVFEDLCFGNSGGRRLPAAGHLPVSRLRPA